MRRYLVAPLGAMLVFRLAATLALADDPPPEVQAAQNVCQDKGLTPGSDAFTQCVEAHQDNARQPLSER